MIKRFFCLSYIVLLSMSIFTVDLSNEQKTNLDIINYGIETQVSELLSRLKNAKDNFYNNELLSLFRSTRSSTLKKSLLEFFTAIDSSLAVDDAINIIESRFDEASTLVQSAFNYLLVLKSDKAIDTSLGIIKNNETLWLLPAIRLAAAVRSAAAAEDLVDLYRNPEVSTNIKEQILLALGNIPSDKAFNLLVDLLEDSSASRIEQMYAATGLGLQGNDQAIPILQKAVFSTIPDVRARAIRSLAAFSDPIIHNSILDALKDAHVTPRLAAVQAVETLKLQSAIPFLDFRLKFDPERVVREASITALAVIGTDRCYEILTSFLEDEKNNINYRSRIFLNLVEYAEAQHSELLRRILSASMANSDRAYFNLLARGLAGMPSPNTAAYLELLLGDRDFSVRLGALAAIERLELQVLREKVVMLSKDDTSEAVRKRAEQTLERLNRATITD